MTRSRRTTYTEQKFDHLRGLDGISDDQVGEHLALYAGYVKQVTAAGRADGDPPRRGRVGDTTTSRAS